MILRTLLAWLNPIALRGGDRLTVLIRTSQGAGGTILRGTISGAAYDPMLQAVVINVTEEV